MLQWQWQNIAWDLRCQVRLIVAVFAILLPTTSAYAQDALACGRLIHPVSGAESAPIVTPGTTLVSLGKSVYFISGDETGAGVGSNALWRTDGTPTGTFTITSSLPDFSPLYLFTTLNGKLLLRAATPASGAELWISDGTAQGTTLLKDVIPGPVGATYQSSWFTVANRVFFAVYADNKNTWWTTDGTPAGTEPAATRYPGELPDNAYFLTQSATEAYLIARVSPKQVTLWRLDHTGFRKVKEFTGSAESRGNTTIGDALIRQGKLYLFIRVAGGPSGLWRSDGTEAGTELILAKDFAVQDDPTVEGGVYPYTLLATARDDLFFFEYDQPLLRLWRLDSTLDSVAPVKTIRLRNEEGLYHNIQFETAITYGAKLYFSLGWRDPQLNSHERELWTSDGTAIGTYRLTRLPLAARLAFGTAPGLFLLGGPLVVHVPWLRPYPTIICNLGSHSFLYPTLFYHQGAIYVAGRNAGAGAEHLWRLEPATLRPTNVFLPAIKN